MPNNVQINFPTSMALMHVRAAPVRMLSWGVGSLVTHLFLFFYTRNNFVDLSIYSKITRIFKRLKKYHLVAVAKMFTPNAIRQQQDHMV